MPANPATVRLLYPAGRGPGPLQAAVPLPVPARVAELDRFCAAAPATALGPVVVKVRVEGSGGAAVVALTRVKGPSTSRVNRVAMPASLVSVIS